MKAILSILISVLVLLPALCAAADLPDGWNFRVQATAVEPAETYEVVLDHGGLAQKDARDIRVFSPAGQPVSHYIAYTGPTLARILFDGVGGPGAYEIHFANPSPALPATPQDLSPFGRKDWRPRGGINVESAAAALRPLEPNDNTSAAGIRAAWKDAADRATAEANKQTEPNARSRFLRDLRIRDADEPIAHGWYHTLRADFELSVAGTVEFALQGPNGGELGVLFVDGQHERPVIEGFKQVADAWFVVGTSGKLDLGAGQHTLELLTNRNAAALAMKRPGEKEFKVLDGMDVTFAGALRLLPSEPGTGQLAPADAYIAVVAGLSQSGQYARAREIVKLARPRLSGDARAQTRLSEEYERAGAAAYDRNWLTEGKHPSRDGAVPDETFTPPLRMSGADAKAYAWDQRHISTTLWVEGQAIYGLPFSVASPPWAITSGTTIADNTLYVGTKNGILHAVDLATRSLRWTFPAGGSCLGSPLLFRSVIYFGAVDRRLYAIDAERGRMLWNFPTEGWIEGSPAADESSGRVYFGSRDGHLYAVDAELGVERWRVNLGAPIVATPCTDGARVYVGTFAGDFCAVDAPAGSIVWKHSTGAKLTGGATLAHGRAFVGDESGRLHAIDVVTGKPVWTTPADVGGPIIASPIIVGPIVFGGTENSRLFGVDSADGSLGWTQQMPGNGSVARPPTFADGNLLFTSRHRSVRDTTGNPVPSSGQTATFRMSPASDQIKWINATEAITIDGELNEPTWTMAPRLPAFLKPNGLMAGPDPGPVDARLAWDEKALYVAVAVTGAGPAPADTLALLIDPRRNGEVVYSFATSAAGTNQAVGVHTGAGLDPANPAHKPHFDWVATTGENVKWSPAWKVATKVRDSDPKGWTAEIAIPLDPARVPIMQGPAVNAAWRINLVVTCGARTWALAPISAVKMDPNPARWGTATFAGPAQPAGK